MNKDLKPKYFDNPYTEAYQNFTQADNSLVKKALGYNIFFTLEKGIKDYATNYLDTTNKK